MNDTQFVIWTLFRHLIGYPYAVLSDFLWFKLNYRPKWLQKSRTKHFRRHDADKARLDLVTSRFRFWLKRYKDSQS